MPRSLPVNRLQTPSLVRPLEGCGSPIFRPGIGPEFRYNRSAAYTTSPLLFFDFLGNTSSQAKKFRSFYDEMKYPLIGSEALHLSRNLCL